jgi:sugar phosphate isomerase/epimerase
VVSIDKDLNRSFDQFAALVAGAAAVGMETTVEFIPGLIVGDLATAVAALNHVRRPGFRLLIDTMHLVRSGGGADDIAALDANLIGYVQICDAPLVSSHVEYFHEALFERRVPGSGELPLLDILSALPRDRVFGLEIPMLTQAQAGIGPHQRLSRCLAATRELFAQLKR